MLSMLVRMRSVISRHPVISNMAICGFMYGAGDISQQTIRKCEKYDWKNSARIATVAFVFFGPIYYRWFKILDKLIIGRTSKEIVLKVIVDQLVIAPPCICIFYIGTSILEKREDKFEQLKEKGLKTFVSGTVYWPFVQFVNFFYLPTHMRTAYVATASFVWTNVLCYIKSEEPNLVHEEQIAEEEFVK